MQRYFTFRRFVPFCLIGLVFGGSTSLLTNTASAAEPVILVRPGTQEVAAQKRGWVIKIQPQKVKMTDEEKIGQTYWRIYRSLPYISNVQFFNPMYRHEMTLQIMFGSRSSGKQPMPPKPAPAHVRFD